MSYASTTVPTITATQHLEAEHAVLGILMGYRHAFDEVGGFLEARHFADPVHQKLWSVLAGLIASNKDADVEAIRDELDQRGQLDECGGMEYLLLLAGQSHGRGGIKRNADRIVEKYTQRQLIDAADSALQIAMEPGDVGAKVDRITSLFDAIQRRQVKKMPRLIGDIAIERIQVYEDLKDGKVIPGWRTHIPALTAKLNGGLRAGGLYVLAARPSVGKSSLSQELGLFLATDNLPTLFLSQEMVDTEVTDRGVSNQGRVHIGGLLTGQMEDQDWDRASEGIEKLIRLPFHIDDQGALTLQDVRLKAKSIKGLKVLIVDYIQLCTSGRRDGANRNSEIEELTRGLKALAKELGIAVIALSQLNRDVEKRANRRPSLSDLRDSGAIEQDADVVMFLWPVRDFDGEGRRIIGLGIDKNRQGRLGDIGLDFYGDTQRWVQSTADISTPPAQAAHRTKTKDL